MAGCVTRCTTYRKDSIQHAWEDIRAHFGPIVDWSTEPGSVAEDDVSEWAAWASANGKSVNDVTFFGKWLIWRLSYGTVEYGNFPSRIRDHEGVSCIPCSYSVSSSSLNTRLWLGLEDHEPLPSKSDHSDYYMKVSARGSKWGFECTADNCPYYLENGVRYFHS